MVRELLRTPHERCSCLDGIMISAGKSLEYRREQMRHSEITYKITGRQSDLFKRTKWILSTRYSFYVLSDELNERKPDWKGKVGRINFQKCDQSIQPSPHDIVTFVQVGATRARMLFGFGEVVETYERERGYSSRYKIPSTDF